MTGATARLRALEAADVAAVTELVVEVLGEFGFTAKVGGIEQDLRDVLDRYAGDAARFWVAEREGRVVGTVAIRGKEGRTCELKRLYLRPSERGTGLGQRLYAHAEDFARAAGYDRIWLESSRRFVRAHGLYRRNGFVLLESLDNDWEDDLYEKRLPPVTPA
ncbi:MAG TPA: GNAT family N-acetyltransferase [Polyangiaceae bacterium]